MADPATQTTQSGNVVAGDQAGRDIIKYITSDNSRPSEMGRLIDRFKAEHQNDPQFEDTVEKLRHYSKPTGDTVLGLDGKLSAGNRQDLLEFATATKEQFAKSLAKHQFSESAQEIHAYLLAEVFTRFNTHVYPLIRQSSTHAQIADAIQTRVVDPVKALLEDNVLGLYADEINGMLFFLTGNCHVRWV